MIKFKKQRSDKKNGKERKEIIKIEKKVKDRNLDTGRRKIKGIQEREEQREHEKEES